MEVTTMTKFIHKHSDKDSTNFLSEILSDYFIKIGIYQKPTYQIQNSEDLVSLCWNFIARNYDCAITDTNDYFSHHEMYDKKIIAMNHDLTDEKLEKYISLFLLQNT